MAVVLMAWELGGGAGHCVKLAPIAEGLIAQGHEVWVAARELVTAKQVFATAPVRYLPAPYLTGRPVNPIGRTRSMADILHNVGFGDATQLDVLTVAWRNLFELIDPDAIICDHAPTALLASRWHPMRRIVLGTGFTVPPATSPLTDLRYWEQSDRNVEALRCDEQALLKRVNELLARDGLATLARLADLYSEVDASFLLTFRELDHYPNREGTDYWGSWCPEGGVAPEWPDGPGPRVFAYLKPPTPAWRLGDFLAYVRETTAKALVYVAGGDPAWLNRFQTPRLKFTHRPVDVSQAASQCDAAILNGNAGSVAAFLLAGIPQLNIPLYLEQIVLSRRVAELGAGLVAHPSRPEQMAARLTALLENGSFRSAAQAFARQYADFKPQQVTAEIIARIHDLLANEKLQTRE